jgi:hypothetical protein
MKSIRCHSGVVASLRGAMSTAIIGLVAFGHCAAKQSDASGATSVTLARLFFSGGDDRLGGPSTAIKNNNRICTV